MDAIFGRSSSPHSRRYRASGWPRRGASYAPTSVRGDLRDGNQGAYASRCWESPFGLPSLEPFPQGPLAAAPTNPSCQAQRPARIETAALCPGGSRWRAACAVLRGTYLPARSGAELDHRDRVRLALRPEGHPIQELAWNACRLPHGPPDSPSSAG